MAVKGLFRKKIDPRCIYCDRGVPMKEREIACPKRGIVDAYDHCRSFVYNPLKRKPPKPVKLRRNYTDEDMAWNVAIKNGEAADTDQTSGGDTPVTPEIPETTEAPAAP